MTSETQNNLVRYVVAGCLNRDFILPVSGHPQLDVLGGNLAYAGVGLGLWGESAGMLAAVGSDFPLDWLRRFRSLGFDLRGIRVRKESLDQRRFRAYSNPTTVHDDNPVQHFSDRGLTFPPALLDYKPNSSKFSSRTTPISQSLQISDIPNAYLDATAVHICPIDYISHMILPSIFRQGQASTITLAPVQGYMSPSFWEEIPGLLSELTAFITTEADLRNLFQGRKTDLWEMVEILASFGPAYILARGPAWGYYLYDREEQRRWIIPGYQTKVVNPVGAEDAFAGSFLVGYRRHYDPVEAALMGNIAASLVLEGAGVYYALETLPDLVEARKSALRELVREL